jgi:hypothetical protein
MLISLDLSHIRVNEDTFKDLLRKCHKLQSLNLNNTHISLGTMDTELASPYIQTLLLGEADFDPAFTDCLKDIFPSVRSLSLAGTPLDARSLENHIPALMELEFLVNYKYFTVNIIRMCQTAQC